MNRLIYSAAAGAGAAGYRLFALRDRKARQFFEIRRGMFDRLEKESVGLGSPRALFHVASVGELLQAMPVMAELSVQGTAVVLSHTSSSLCNNMPREVAADLVTPSPLDRPSLAGRFMDIVRPDLVLFSTYDLWPGMVMEAVRRGIPVIMINASLPEGAGRLKFPGRMILQKTYKSLSAAGAISAEHADRLSLLGVARDRVHVTGNCRFDQTLERCRSVNDQDPDVAVIPLRFPCIVAGSTWPEDHKRLLPALFTVMQKHPDMRAIIAPHEPTGGHVAEIESFFAGSGMGTVRYQSLREGAGLGAARVIVVNALGVLYKLYSRADMAYVGGSFRQGVHNVMEPGGMGLPVIFGPEHKNSEEALEMLRDGGAEAVSSGEDIVAVVERWLDDEDKLAGAGKAALGVVERNAGATDRTVSLVREFL